MTSPTRWGLIGASTIASQWVIDAIRAEGAGEVGTLVSSSAGRGAAYAARHDIPAAETDLDGMLADRAIDAVYISTTNERHRDQALAAIRAGKHVLCEKPLALTLDDARSMVDAAAKAGLVFTTNHHLRNADTARFVLDDEPVGEVALRTAAGETALPLTHENLYARALRRFHGAIRGADTVAASGEDGVRSLATALAVLDSCRTGQTVSVAG